jgi:hypothetical protein
MINKFILIILFIICNILNADGSYIGIGSVITLFKTNPQNNISFSTGSASTQSKNNDSTFTKETNLFSCSRYYQF